MQGPTTMSQPPDHYFRLRENGAQVFRVLSDGRRLGLEPIAVANLRSGEVKQQGEHHLTEADLAAIETWMEGRRALLARREADEIQRTIEHLNHTALWAQSRASDDDLEAVTEPLLLAMHDLRAILVRKKANRETGAPDHKG